VSAFIQLIRFCLVVSVPTVVLMAGGSRAQESETVLEVAPVPTSSAEPPAAPVTPPPAASPAPAPSAPSAKPAPTPAADNGRIKVAVMQLAVKSGAPAKLADVVSTAMAEEIDNLGAFDAISAKEIKDYISYQADRALAGCDDESCYAQVAEALGAPYVVFGSVTPVDDELLLQVQLFRIKDVKVIARVSRPSTTSDAALIKAARSSVRGLFRELLAGKEGGLAIEVSEEGATVRLDEQIVGVAPVKTLTIPSGPHHVVIEKEGFITARRDVQVVEGAEVKVSFTLVPSQEFINSYKTRTYVMHGLAWGALGLSAASFAGAAGLYGTGFFLASSTRDHITAYNAQDLRTTAEYDQIQTEMQLLVALDVAVFAAIGVGAVALVTGGVLMPFTGNPWRYDDIQPGPEE
jgi:TolB-like protein